MHCPSLLHAIKYHLSSSEGYFISSRIFGKYLLSSRLVQLLHFNCSVHMPKCYTTDEALPENKILEKSVLNRNQKSNGHQSECETVPKCEPSDLDIKHFERHLAFERNSLSNSISNSFSAYINGESQKQSCNEKLLKFPLPHISITSDMTENIDLLNTKSTPSISNETISALNAKIDGEFLDNIAPVLPRSFNLAAYANHSETLQQLVKLGVKLDVLEKKLKISEFILKLDFERDVKKYIRFLHDIGLPTDDLGKVLTKAPLILDEPVENLQIRINYLKAKKFPQESIVRIITNIPSLLLLNTKEIDSRLGFFQKQFHLTGNEVRHLIAHLPKLVTYSLSRIKKSTFIIIDEAGFSEKEVKHLLLTKPKLWIIAHYALRERFDFIHNEMGIPHERILQFPGVLLRRKHLVEHRHKYLSILGRAQYDPTKPLYVSLQALVCENDSEFCIKRAKTSVEDFNKFLKTL